MPASKQCCDPCRLTHHKCDRHLPRCSRCVRTDQKCTQGQRETRFRSTKGPSARTRFPHNQVWLQPPPRVDFVLEHGSVDPGGFPETSTGNLSPEARLWSLDHPIPDTEVPTANDAYHSLSPQSDAPEQRPHTTRDRSGRILPIGGIPKNPPELRAWPLQDPVEADLLQHFVDKIAPFFDCTDPQRHFAVYIPYRSRHCEALFNAILAMSARHLSLTASFGPYVSDRYYQTCLERLIPALDDHEVTMDDDFLAATVILRLLEEYDAPLAGADLRGHSFGTKAFIQGRTPTTAASSLRQAVYWSGLRQEIYNALSLQTPPNVHLSSVRPPFSPAGPGADDCAWANQAIAHCADVLRFCFGDDARSVDAHAELKLQNRQWRDARPDSFDPYFVGAEADAEPTLPEIRFGSAWHTIGSQYNELARILLAVHDPALPTVGPSRRRYIEEADDQIRKGVRRVCGIALSNTTLPPAMVVGCMAIHICGDRFTDPREQDLLIGVLKQTEARHGWPTRALQQQLRDTWVV